MDRYKKLFWLFCGALFVFTAGNLVGSGLLAYQIKTDCHYMSKFRIVKSVFECRPDYSYIAQKPKTGGK